jgi:hypothetical protein
VNYVFPARLAFVLSLWCGGKQLRQAEPKETGDVLTIGGHVLFTILLAMEMYRWGEHAAFISQRMAVSLISAIWAVQAFVLIWLGLVTRNLPQRILGFVLFGVTIAKVLLRFEHVRAGVPDCVVYRQRVTCAGSRLLLPTVQPEVTWGG